MINDKTNRHIVIDGGGHIVEVVRDPKAPGYAMREDQPNLKSGWRLATDADIAHAKDVEAKRAAKEAAEAAKALAEAKAAQDKADKAVAESGGPLRKK